METELRQFADHQDHRTSDSTFLVFMSHGILDGICGTKHCDDKPDVLHDDTIFTIFNNHNCKNLRDKPKIIIMQACRGSEFELGPQEMAVLQFSKTGFYISFSQGLVKKAANQYAVYIQLRKIMK